MKPSSQKFESGPFLFLCFLVVPTLAIETHFSSFRLARVLRPTLLHRSTDDYFQTLNYFLIKKYKDCVYTLFNMSKKSL